MAKGVMIKDAPLVESVNGTEKVPVSDGSGEAKAVSLGQIKQFVESDDDFSKFATKEQLSEELGGLAEVAKSGSYNDLSDKPEIPNAVTENTVEGWGFTKNEGTYIKPSAGIPKTDLTRGVQSSLDKADTALQESDLDYFGFASKQELLVKQDILVSGQNIKTINGQDILGEGDIEIIGGAGGGETYKVSIDLLSKMYNAVSLGSKGNYIEFTFDILSSNDMPTGEPIVVTYDITKGATTTTITETYRYGSKVSFNVDKYLSEGTNVVTITVKGKTSLASTIFAITYDVISLTISDYLDISKVYNLTNNGVDYLEIPYDVTGSYSKIVEWYIDGVKLEMNRTEDEILETTPTSRIKTIELSNMQQGRHSLQIRVGSKINGDMFYSDTLYRDFFIYTGADENFMMGIATTIPASVGILTSGVVIHDMTEYIGYTFQLSSYSPIATANTTIHVAFNDEVVSSISAKNGTVTDVTIVPSIKGEKTLKLYTDTMEYLIPCNVAATDISITEITDSLSVNFSARGKSNNGSDKDTWTDGKNTGTLTGFKWNNQSGWVNDRLEISKDAELHIACSPLSSHPNGKTLEFEWSSKNVSDENTILCDLRNESGTGILITASAIVVTSVNGEVIERKYKSDENVRMSVVINPERGVNKGLTFVYINGIVSAAKNIVSGDSYESDAELIFKGSAGACVSLKYIRIYDIALSTDQILNNYNLYRDSVSEMLEVYNRNDIYDGNAYDIAKMSSRLPVMLVTGDIPTLENTNDKDTQIIVDIEYTNMQDPSRSFTMEGAAMRPQGTSSMGYPKKNFRIYTQKIDTTRLYVNGKEVKNKLYAFKEKSIPVNCWCLKADYAESSGTHNTAIARMWGDAFKNAQVTLDLGEGNPHNVDEKYMLRTTAQQKAIDYNYNYDVRTTIDGLPILLFYRRTTEDDIIFLGKYNFNNDKSTEKVFGFTDIPGFDNRKMQCWEFLNNGNPIGLFTDISDFYNDVVVDGKTMKGWQAAFESRYPDTKTPNTNDLYTFASWINGVNGNATRFTEEKWEHLDVFKVAGYYCYLKRHAGADQFVKNAMLTSEDGVHFYFILYDNDTINGLNNTGDIAILPTDDRDSVYEDGSHKFAGYDSVLWNMLEADSEFMEVVKAVDDALYTAGISYKSAIKAFDEDQADKWAERIYNLDAEYKYISPYTNSGVNNLFMLQGNRSIHRKWWLANRFSLYDSLFVSGAYKSGYVEIKCIDETTPTQTFEVTSGYPIYYGYGINGKLRQRTDVTLAPDTKHTFSITEKVNLGDPIAIYGAPHLKALDLSPMMDRIAVLQLGGIYNEALGTKLEVLKIGSSVKVNNRLTEISGIKNAKALTYLDITNIKNLTAIDLSENVYLQKFIATGTNIASATFADGAPINELWLPSTMRAVKLTSLPELSTNGLHFENISNVRSLDISGCPNLSNDFNWVYNWYQKKSVENKDAVLHMDNVDWVGVNSAQLIELANIQLLQLKGRITITEISQEIIDRLSEAFGESVFDKTSELYIQAPAGLFIGGINEFRGGESIRLTAALFPEVNGMVEWSISSGSGASIQSSSNLHCTVTATESTSRRTITVQAKYIPYSGDILYATKTISVLEVIRATGGSITGPSTVGSSDEFTFTAKPTTINTPYSVTWSLTGDAATAGHVVIQSQNNESCKVQVTSKVMNSTFNVVATLNNGKTTYTITKSNILIGVKFTLHILSNQADDEATFANVKATVKYGSSSTTMTNGKELNVSANTEIKVTFPSVTNYKTPAPIEFVIGEEDVERTGTYLTEKVEVTLSAYDGGDVNGATVNINGVNYTWGGTTIVTKIPFGTEYEIRFVGVGDYWSPDSMSLTASQAVRRIVAEYTSVPEAAIIIDQTISDPATMIRGNVNSSVIQAIRAGSHRYLGKCTAEGEMTLCQLDDDNSNYYADGTDAVLTGEEGDVFMKMPDFWYRSVEVGTDVWGIQFQLGAEEPEGADWIRWDTNALIGAFKMTDDYDSTVEKYVRTQFHNSVNTIIQERGVGFQHIDYQMHCVMAILFYAQYGHTNSQEKIGPGLHYDSIKKTGTSASYGMVDTKGISPVVGVNDNGVDATSGTINFWGLEDWWGGRLESLYRIDIVGDGKLAIKDKDGVLRYTSEIITGGFASKFLFGKHCDLIVKEVNNSGTTGFCDYNNPRSTNTSYVVVRGSYITTDAGIAVLATRYVGGQNAVSSRLAFRGNCVIVESPEEFKALTALS